MVAPPSPALKGSPGRKRGRWGSRFPQFQGGADPSEKRETPHTHRSLKILKLSSKISELMSSKFFGNSAVESDPMDLRVSTVQAEGEQGLGAGFRSGGVRLL